MQITEDLLNTLSEQAKTSPRLRVAYDLRTTPDDNSQRMLCAMEPGTQVAIHRHLKTSESLAVIRGSIRQNFYNDKGELTESLILKAGAPLSFVHVPKGAWHKAECLESDTIFFEAKDGAYAPLAEDEIMTI